MNNANIKWRPRTAINIKMMTLLLLPLMAQCQGGTSGTAPYDFGNPVVFQLSKELKEISGLVFISNKLYAITDNSGTLFELDMNNGKVLAEWKFAKAHDYEGVAFTNGRFYVLNSNGNILSFSVPGNSKPDVQEFKFPFEKGNEFEILYYNDNSNQLVMICKECKDDKKKSISVYTIDPSTGQYSRSSFTIDAEEVAKKHGSKNERLKLSAAAIHPQTGEVYLISSVNKMLIRMNRNGKVLSVNSLNRSLFEQPEGITFTAAGDLLISNEEGKKEKATLLLFKNKSK